MGGESLDDRDVVGGHALEVVRERGAEAFRGFWGTARSVRVFMGRPLVCGQA